MNDLLPSLPNLGWIHANAAGIDDLVSPERTALFKRGVWMTNISGGYAAGMVEYVVAAMVMLSRPFPLWQDAARAHRWLDRFDTAGDSRYFRPQLPWTSGGELQGKQVGIIGYGSVGRYLATVCKALGMRVWATRRTPSFSTGEPVDRLLTADELPLLLETSDFLVLAASLNATTRHLIDAAALRRMKKGAFLVNVARGEVVDQAALIAALEAGTLGGAILDVTTPEPLPSDSPLWRAPNLLITPHVSGDTPEGWQRGIDLFCGNLQLYLDGRPEKMGNIVRDYPFARAVLSSGRARGVPAAPLRPRPHFSSPSLLEPLTLRAPHFSSPSLLEPLTSRAPHFSSDERWTIAPLRFLRSGSSSMPSPGAVEG